MALSSVCRCIRGDEALSFPSKRHQKLFLLVVILFSITVIILLNFKTAGLVTNPSIIDQDNPFVKHTVERSTDRVRGHHHNQNSESVLYQPQRVRISTPKPGRLSTRHTEPNKFIDVNLHLDMSTKERRMKLLWWNQPGWMGNWDRHVNMDQCSYSNCELTTDRKHFHDSSAVLYSITDEGMTWKPPVIPAHRNPDQAWVFYSLESPSVLPEVNPNRNNRHWHNVFNWSWSYRSDADIFHPYGIFKTKDIPTFKNYSEIYRRKKRSVAWLVSHCLTVSYREDFVKILRKYIDIDIYGDCGKPATATDIEDAISRDYKFYLGFENALCKDYVTEKLFHYYKMDLITVVRGFVHYNRFVPNGTFINTADFPNIKAVAEFLHKLGDNEDEYVEYLKRKDKYDVYERRVMYRNALCSICEKLNNLEQNRKVYTDIYKWLGYCYVHKDMIDH